MKKNIIWLAATLLIGFALGFMLKPATKVTEEHRHDQETAAGQEQETIWTCSMHPQIRQPEPGQCPICGMDLIPLDESASSGSKIRLEMSEEAVKLAQIQTTVVGGKSAVKEGASRGLKLDGKIKVDERRIGTQTAHLNGRIEKLYVSFTGEYVRRGQRLADIYAPDLITAQRELQEAARQTTQPALLQAARNKLRYWKLSDEQIEALEKGGDIIERFPIHADQNGFITRRMVSVGDYVKTGSPLYEVADLSRVWVVFDAYESDLPKIKIGQEVQFSTPALPGKVFTAHISYIDPLVNPKTRSTAVRAEINNAGQQLKPEMLVQGEIMPATGSLSAASAKSSKALLVPKSAVLWTGLRSVVYVQVADEPAPAFEFREVELGERIGDMYEILSGLEAGERVVTYGAFAIDAAAQLNNQSSMMNRLLEESGGEEKKTEEQSTPDYREQAPEAFKEQLGKVIEAYLLLKDELVAGEAEKAAEHAQKVLDRLGEVKMELLKGDAHMYWMDLLKGSKKQARAIADSGDIEAQRKAFAYLSAHLTEAVKAFGISGLTVYQQHCPMAMDNQGADWLSTDEKIRNPYFGDAMLSCGSVVDTL